MNRQNPLTLITPIKPDKLGELREILDYAKYTLENIKGFEERVKFKELYEEVHYLRWIIIDDPNSEFFRDKGPDQEPKLVYSSNFDRSIDHHLDALAADDLASIEKMDGKAIHSEQNTLTDQIYSCCEGYPEKRDAKSRKDYLKKHMVGVSAFYKGSPRRSVSQIKKENKLRVRLRELLDENKKDWKNLTAREIHQKLRSAIANEPDYKWTKDKFKMPRKSWPKFILLILVILILLPVIVIWQMIVQFGHENKDKYFTTYRSDIPRGKTEILEEYEDLTDGERPEPIARLDLPADEAILKRKKDMVINYQNQFSQLVDMKPGKVRLITFNAMMLFARVLIPIWYVEGKLLNIPTIHFARWVLFDDNKRVLFFSNFDGSWQQYLGDFIDQSGWGLSAIFSNTTVFPKTNWLGITGLLSMRNILPKSKNFFPGGAYDEEHFLAWSRSTELPTNIWYSAYPDLSIKNVNNNSRIRVMLAKNLSEKKARKFFELI